MNFASLYFSPWIFSVIFSVFFNGKSEPEWNLTKEDEGIKIYTRYIEGSEIRAFKAVALMEGKLSEFVSVLKDVENFPELFDSNKLATILEQNDTMQWYYSVTAVPWPLKDRDGIYCFHFKQNYQNKIVTIKVVADPDRMPENDGIVRIRKAEGTWILEPMDINKVRVTLEMHGEPGGSIPDWIANMFVVDSPIKDFKNLRERIALDQYKNKKYDFLVEY